MVLQFHTPFLYVLTAGAVTLGLGDYVDAGVVTGVVLINARIGSIQEGKAEQARDAVRLPFIDSLKVIALPAPRG
ncbi:hypothetical protein [Polaromonas glacialis]|uniref:hypothetical protein n=1 Tax=Polaromonas glacialis TaxID=866564 RepID=UPI000A02F872|nr:hypothetical protein [Polaromonas glacialis]